MGISTIGMRLSLCLIGWAWLAICQTPAAAPSAEDLSSPVLYEAFFREAARTSPTQEAMINGEGAGNPSVSNFPDAMGLTAAETEMVRAKASECNRRVDEVTSAMRTLVFESRLQYVDKGEVSPSLVQRITALKEQSDQIILDQVKELKAALGDAQFDKLEAYVRTPEENRPGAAPRPHAVEASASK